MTKEELKSISHDFLPITIDASYCIFNSSHENEEGDIVFRSILIHAGDYPAYLKDFKEQGYNAFNIAPLDERKFVDEILTGDVEAIRDFLKRYAVPIARYKYDN